MAIGIGYYSRLWVKQDFRGNGYGRELWDKTQELLDELHLDLIIPINPYGGLTYDQLKRFYSSEQTVDFIEGLKRIAKEE